MLECVGHCKGDAPLEIERKFLIEYPKLDFLESQPDCRRVEITQTYLRGSGDTERRVRMMVENGIRTYWKTEKRKISELMREEREEEIGEDTYRTLLEEADSDLRQICKTRYCFRAEGHLLEIDLYPFWRDRAILEVELDRVDEVLSLPREICVLREVSGDAAYKNAALARRIPE